ncbi:MAG: MoaD/ThiS family protein [Syntrophomonadaceae bacterium]|nr:MoaD/ThiS family protein [Syntrophomonadaceae bacterium]MDD3890530.1 MoaD/ThiS family protein [Syntrophomonadaceae bacterium]MDD4550009.1 MoaD/ThiS family protein [Syntrophomonadaceae bacterium]
MQVKVKLFFTLRRGRSRVVDIQLNPGATVKEVIINLGIKPSEVAIVMVNGHYSNMEKQVDDGDIVALFPPIGGG